MNIDRIKEIFTIEDNITRTAKKYCEESGIDYNDSFRKRVSVLLRGSKVDSDLENETSTETNQYGVMSQLSALKPDGTIMSLKEYCEFYKIPYEEVRTYKLVTH